MPELPVDPETNTPAVVVVPDAPKPRNCEFCGCQLSERGEVLSMSDKAKKFVRLEMKIDSLQETVQARDTQINQLQSELAALRRATEKPADSSSSFLK